MLYTPADCGLTPSRASEARIDTMSPTHTTDRTSSEKKSVAVPAESRSAQNWRKEPLPTVVCGRGLVRASPGTKNNEREPLGGGQPLAEYEELYEDRAKEDSRPIGVPHLAPVAAPPRRRRAEDEGRAEADASRRERSGEGALKAELALAVHVDRGGGRRLSVRGGEAVVDLIGGEEDEAGVRWDGREEGRALVDGASTRRVPFADGWARYGCEVQHHVWLHLRDERCDCRAVGEVEFDARAGRPKVLRECVEPAIRRGEAPRGEGAR
mmetsp:Transcript_20254/g.63492  ORF Transcript_20254/g.63492 Transcript_20254/m.63492 type:complete len:268 (+) Transcript_20254:597-1400(+)